MLAQNSNFLQMKVVYFRMFKQIIVNFGKFFLLLKLSSLSLCLLYLYFSLLLQVILHSAKEKRKTLTFEVRELNLSLDHWCNSYVG